MRRFLQHVLPKGFHKVRYYGLWHTANRQLANQARLVMTPDDAKATEMPEADAPRHGFNRCPYCGGQRLDWVRELSCPKSRST